MRRETRELSFGPTRSAVEELNGWKAISMVISTIFESGRVLGITI